MEKTIRYSTLSDKSIISLMEEGEIIINPFDRMNLSTSSYDFTLGEWFYRATKWCPHEGSAIYNPYSEDDVKRVWGEAQKAPLVSEWRQKTKSKVTLKGISEQDRVIWIGPKETLLAHTQEFIGGTKTVTTMMKARSSMGRNFIEVCKCAGWGDVGYTNRWTMEITNNSTEYAIPLIVGRRIGQIIFFKTDGIENDAKNYTSVGKYQSSQSIEELVNQWTPECMLPKMYKDRECSPDFKRSTDICGNTEEE